MIARKCHHNGLLLLYYLLYIYDRLAFAWLSALYYNQHFFSRSPKDSDKIHLSYRGYTFNSNSKFKFQFFYSYWAGVKSVYKSACPSMETNGGRIYKEEGRDAEMKSNSSSENAPKSTIIEEHMNIRCSRRYEPEYFSIWI